MIFPCVFKYITKSGNLLVDNLVLLLNREGSFRTESVPDGKLPAGNHRQFRCYCPLVAFTAQASARGKVGDREAGIDSVAEFRGLVQSGHPRFETPRSTPVAQAFLPVFFRG